MIRPSSDSMKRTGNIYTNIYTNIVNRMKIQFEPECIIQCHGKWKSVCAGYSRAFQYLMMQLDIPCYFSSGYANNNYHVEYSEKSTGYFAMSICHGMTYRGGFVTYSYQYFNISDKVFSQDHKRPMSPLSFLFVIDHKDPRPQMKKYDLEKQHRKGKPCNRAYLSYNG